MYAEVHFPMSDKEHFSYAQIAVSCFLGTPVAGAYLVSRNIAVFRGNAMAWTLFSAFVCIFVFVAAINPIANRLLDVGLFIVYTIGLLALNWQLAEPIGSNKRSWMSVLAISFAFLVAWLVLILAIFG